ncbi:hypothetical protein [Alteribacter natronophilus]|uniref:hypothetical protein n=1 Tax=Alteribacter natronophilus TaxID=2583810 RepID=UPI00110E97D8|nr:hypothetical protein [Alteribacter natronophilus]TMW73412.1 hypothetical protein FGB90_03670 [Alteribacter natronophilus]
MRGLTKEQVKGVRKVKTRQNENQLLNKENVTGIGIGEKVVNGVPTGKPALLTFVTSKQPAAMLKPADLVPEFIDGVPTDVIEIGSVSVQPDLQREMRTLPGNALTSRIRPVKGGWSVGHPDITAGTAGAIVTSGEGTQEAKYFILSNNHVLANSNEAVEGDPVIQPGSADGGRLPDDQVAVLTKFIPIDLTPDVPADDHDNFVDAAIAEGSLQELDREVYWSGYIKGAVAAENVATGMRVRKTGRTTGYTTGEITAVEAVIDVNFGGDRTGRFRDQIVTTPISEGGDSGSVVTDLDSNAVGLLFAGSPQATILNQIEHVQRLLNIRFA